MTILHTILCLGKVYMVKNQEDAYRLKNLSLFGGAGGLPVCLSACLPVCLFQLVSGEVSLPILTSTIVGEHRRVFNNYPATRHGKSCNPSADMFC